MDISVEGVISDKLGLVSHQNAVPLIRTLTIANRGGNDFADLLLELTPALPFAQPRTWRIDRLAAGAALDLPQRDIQLCEGYLADLTEAVCTGVDVRVRAGREVLGQRHFPLQLLPANGWGGVGGMAELLPAYCTPNDPAVDRVLKAAADALRAAGRAAALDGYQRRSRSRAWDLVSAIYSAVCGFGLSYALPPASFERQGQKIRSPSHMLHAGVATCLDTALLFAAALEQAGLNPLIVLLKEHAFCGAWLQPQQFAQVANDDPAAVRKRVELHELVVFETTLATQSPAPAFSHAIAAANDKLTDDAAFVTVVDVRRARMQQVRPMNVSGHAPQAAADAVAAAPVGMETAPALPDCDVQIESAPATPTGKLEYWRRKLLDLTTRNRLLHLPRSAKAVWLACPDPARLEDLLAAGKALRIAAMPPADIGGRDGVIYAARHGQSLETEQARQALRHLELLSPMAPDKLEARLLELYRKSRADRAEGGSNTLFLALGFLRWKKTKADARAYDAPLVLLPVTLSRTSVRHRVTLTLLDDEAHFNQTLLELLWQDFGLKLPALRGPLPRDGQGIDLDRVLTALRQAVRDMSGFEVLPDVALSTFSFAKYLMWRDLRARSAELADNVLVQRLLRPRQAEPSAQSAPDMVRPGELDQKVDPENLFLPLPADSSQLAAIVASASGESFVLDGPPGTGKSQTIANMIAHNLALGRRILFVAEKRAALDVVKGRLERQGLGEFCLEMHSSKASRKEVLQQLDRAWSAPRPQDVSAWPAAAAEVRRRRDQLNAVVRALHQEHANGWSLFAAMARVVRAHTPATPVFSWPAATHHDATQMRALREVAGRLDLAWAAVAPGAAQFALLRTTAWSNGWQDAMVAAARGVLATLPACMQACRDLDAAIGLELTPSLPVADGLVALGKLLADAHGQDMRFAFRPDTGRIGAALAQAEPLLRQYHQARRRLSQAYAASASAGLDVAAYERAWQAAGGKLWPLSALAKKRVAKDLAMAGATAALPDVEADLGELGAMQSALAGLAPLQPLLAGVPGWSGLDTKLVQAKLALRLADKLQATLIALAQSPQQLVRLRRRLQQLLCADNARLAADGALAQSVGTLIQARAGLTQALQAFAQLAGHVDEPMDASAQALHAGARAVVEHAAGLHDWCLWQHARAQAIGLGLAPLVAALESGSVAAGGAAAAFETAYAAWFARQTMDAEPLIRDFSPAVHEDVIARYRAAIERLSGLTTAYIRARLTGALPPRQGGTPGVGYRILQHELQKKSRHRPVRKLMREMGADFRALAPCMLMSPLSIAQYLPADHPAFDLVIFDEASQVTPWDAAGAVGRARQVIVAGDPKQMPPTNFFNRSAEASDDDTEEDMESILNEFLAAGFREYRLGWHYRSRHEDLIAFANHAYYGDGLVTFPAPTQKRAVAWRHVPGVYARAAGRHNAIEAKAVVAEVVQRLRDPAFVASGQSLGVITLNAEQQRLISDLLDQAQREHPGIERFFDEDRAEPVIVKNLETMQGDERDLIILSVGFGPTEPGTTRMSMNFGPLNKAGGERRLNVAITRARQEMLVFTSFTPAMIDLGRTAARAVADLRRFIEFADRGVAAIAATVRGSMDPCQSPFEHYVAEALQAKGWTVHSQIGVSRFRIDLAVVHPQRPGEYLVGIECDGASYHGAATARDRDKVRADILRGYGWRLLRVWSTAWWFAKQAQIERLDTAIRTELAQQQAEEAAARAPVIEVAPEPEPEHESEPEPERESESESERGSAPEPASESGPAPAPPACAQRAPAPTDEGVNRPTPVPSVASVEAEALIARAPPTLVSLPDKGAYHQADLSEYARVIDPRRFHDADYDSVLSVLVGTVMEAEAPILDQGLVDRIARMHGFKRSGRRIRDRVLDLVRTKYFLQRDVGVGYGAFVWLSEDDVARWQTFRLPQSPGDLRQAEEIPRQELRAAWRVARGADRALAVARMFGIRRLSQSARRRIETVCQSEA